MNISAARLEAIRVFVASPSDVHRERDALAGVINELNRTISALMPDAGVRLDLVRWETHAHPAMGRPQEIINNQVGKYDIFVGILWKRFGTPTGKAESGTEEELKIAYEGWKNNAKPHILFYFNNAPLLVPRSVEEAEQITKVVRMREDLNLKGLVWEYSGYEQFADVVRPHLTEVIGSLLRASRVNEPAPTAERKENKYKKSQSSSPGTKIRITDIGQDDAFYDDREQFIGLQATIVEVEEYEDWWGGTIKLDEVRFESDDPSYPFAQFKFQAL